MEVDYVLRPQGLQFVDNTGEERGMIVVIFGVLIVYGDVEYFEVFAYMFWCCDSGFP
jgi:hypothetical protein